MSPALVEALEARHPSFREKNLLRENVECGDGWFNLLDRLITNIEARHPSGVMVNHVKEKWGLLRVGADGIDDWSFELLRAAERESATVCEVCGAVGVLRRGSPVATRCSAHVDASSDGQPRGW